MQVVVEQVGIGRALLAEHDHRELAVLAGGQRVGGAQLVDSDVEADFGEVLLEHLRVVGGVRRPDFHGWDVVEVGAAGRQQAARLGKVFLSQVAGAVAGQLAQLVLGASVGRDGDGDRAADHERAEREGDQLLAVGGEVDGGADARVGVGLDLAVDVRGHSVGDRILDRGDLVLAQLGYRPVEVFLRAGPLVVEEVELSVDKGGDPQRGVADPDPAVAVEVGLTLLVVVGVALELQFDLRLARDAHHAAGADLRLEIGGERRVAEGIHRVARHHQHVVLGDRFQDRRERLCGLHAHREFVARLEPVDQREAVLEDELRIVEAEALQAEDGVFGGELAAVQRRLVVPEDIRLDRVDEVQLVDDLGQVGHAAGDHEALVEVVEPVVDLVDAGVGAAVDGDGGVEDAAVRHHDPHVAAVLGLPLGGGLRDRRRLLRIFLLLRRLRLPIRLLGRLRLRRSLRIVVVIVAAADQRQTGRADASAGAGMQQRSPAQPVAAHPFPVVPLAHDRSSLSTRLRRRSC